MTYINVQSLLNFIHGERGTSPVSQVSIENLLRYVSKECPGIILALIEPNDDETPMLKILESDL